MDMRSTRAARSKKKAIKAEKRNKHLDCQPELIYISLKKLIKRQKLTCNDAWGDGGQERGLCASVDPGQDAEEKSVFCHGVNDPGHGEHGSEETGRRWTVSIGAPACVLLQKKKALKLLTWWRGHRAIPPPRCIWREPSPRGWKPRAEGCLCSAGSTASSWWARRTRRSRRRNRWARRPRCQWVWSAWGFWLPRLRTGEVKQIWPSDLVGHVT